MDNSLNDLMEKYPDKVRAVLNLLVESAYFYSSDNEDNFKFLRRHHQEFSKFYQDFYGWTLIIDSKCARVYKDKWYNESITPKQRMQFNFTRRDECIAFMLLLEFFEHQLEESSMTVDDKQNLRFRFGDLLQYCHRRFNQLLVGKEDKYTQEYIRAHILREVVPQLIRYRFLKEIPRPQGIELDRDDLIFEALPALYHYNAGHLTGSLLDGTVEDVDIDADDTFDTDNLEDIDDDLEDADDTEDEADDLLENVEAMDLERGTLNE